MIPRLNVPGGFRHNIKDTGNNVDVGERKQIPAQIHQEVMHWVRWNVFWDLEAATALELQFCLQYNDK